MTRIGITLGDPSGIGPEITVKALADIGASNKNLTIIGSASILNQTIDMLSLDVSLPEIVDTGDVTLKTGEESKEGGEAALDALRQACNLLNQKELDALVTAPLSKKAVQFTDPSFTGHTEFLARAFGAQEVLMIAHAPNVSFAFVTTHIPLRDVSGCVTSRLVLDKLILYSNFLGKLPGSNSRIAVFAANPHGAEFSHGEEEEIEKAVEMGKSRGMNVEGPYPADTFGKYMEEVDGFLACYHDQGMIPAKFLSGGKGVNITWGLPFIRTSPLHGTAFDIAGKGIADPRSMSEAIKMAETLSRN